MDGVTAYALSKKVAASAVSGVQSMSVSGQTLTINTKDSGVLTMTFPQPKDGISVTDIDVNANNQIVFTMSDGSEFISGKIPTVKGETGDTGKSAYELAKDNGFVGTEAEYLESLKGLKGDAGVSPTITENADNTDKIYKLDITTADSTFTTPNLKGADGQGGTGGSGEENKIDSISVNGVNVVPDENKNVDITVPEAYDDTEIRAELANKSDTDHTHTTVNGHTVESDVPVDAKFTDTIYDDTEVKESIEELNSNLVQLEFNELSGGKNLFKGYFFPTVLEFNENYTNRDLSKEMTPVKSIVGFKYAIFGAYLEKGTYTFSYTNNTFISLNRVAIAGTICGGSSEHIRKSFTWTQDVDGWTYFSIECDYSESEYNDTPFSITPNIQIEEGATATEYESYIPSVKMLAEENAQQSSNLDGLGYGENGVRNLFEDEIKWMENIPITRGTKSVSDGKITLTATSADCYTDHDVSSWKNNGIKTIPCKPNTKYTFSWEYEGDSVGDIYIFENGSTNNISYTINKSHKLLITTSADAEYLIVRVGVRDSGTSITYWNFQLEEGTTATPYKPYIPSVKMLADETVQQNTEAMDLKILGWTVPTECPIQNEVSGNQFIQKVGRVDLGSLEWTYLEDNLRFYATITERKPIYGNNTDIYCSKYATVIISSDNADKTIGSAYHKTPSDIGVRDLSYTDATAFKSANNGVYVYYELATPITMTIDGNECTERINDSLSVIGKCKNLLNPTLNTDTHNGITFTRNDDGTYSLSGSRTDTSINAYTTFIIDYPLEKGRYKLTGALDENNNIRCIIKESGSENRNIYDYGDGVVLDVNKTGTTITLMIVSIDDTSQTRIIKPMLTTNLNATYDDFVPYTGDGGSLNWDVASLLKRIETLESLVNKADTTVTG